MEEKQTILLRSIIISGIIALIITFGIKEAYLIRQSDGWTERSIITKATLISIPIKQNFSLEETFSLIHETGHVIYDHLNKEQKSDWEVLFAEKSNGFVSEYAMTNAEEDFAESWAYYLYYDKNLVPTQKRLFIKKVIEEQINGIQNN